MQTPHNKQFVTNQMSPAEWPAIFDGRRTIEQEVSKQLAQMNPKNLGRRDVIIRLHLMATAYLAWAMHQSGMYAIPPQLHDGMKALVHYLGHGVTPEELRPHSDALMKQLEA